MNHTPLGMACLTASMGRMADAEAMMTAAIDDVTAEYGQGSPEWASAQSDFGELLFTAGAPERAVDYFRRAAEVPGRDDETRRDQLTYRTNASLALRRLGRLDEAEVELRRGAEERLAFYGREHPGYAFGLEPLAGLLLECGDARQAATVAGEAVDILRRNEHPRLKDVLVMRAVALHGAGEAPFPDLDELPDQTVEEVAELMTGQNLDPALVSALAKAAGARLGPDHPVTLEARRSRLGSARRYRVGCQPRWEHGRTGEELITALHADTTTVIVVPSQPQKAVLRSRQPPYRQADPDGERIQPSRL